MYFRLLMIGCFLMIFHWTHSQECNTFFPLKEGTSFELTSYNKKDKIEGVAIHEVISRTQDGMALDVVMNSTLLDDDGDELQNMDYEVRCQDGIFYIDVTSMMNPQLTESFRNMEFSMESEEMALPQELEVGQDLPDASTEIKLASGGLNLMTFNFSVVNRSVDAKEEVTTPAGTFDCYKISYDLEMKIGLNKQMSIKEWYAPKAGMVRSETYNKKGKLTGYTVLTKLKTP